MSRGRALEALRLGLLCLILAAVVWTLGRNWAAVSGELRQMSWEALMLALSLFLLTAVLSLLGWWVLLADLGSQLPAGPAAGVFFVGQLAKYLPGSIWTVFAQAEMGARLKIPRRRTAVVSLLTIGLAILSGIVLGVPALALLVTQGNEGVPWWWLLLAGAVGAILLWPPVLNRLVALGLRLLRREPLEHDLGGGAILLAATWFVGAWMAAGVSVLVLSLDVAPTSSAPQLAIACVSGFALASVAGILAVLVPAGVGVRDVILALVLGTFMPMPAATAVVLVARFLTVLGDVIMAGLGWALSRAYRV